MTPAAKERRDARHAAEKAQRMADIVATPPPPSTLTFAMPRDLPRLTWLNAKAHPQMTGGRKNVSGHQEEHADALYEQRQKEVPNEIA
jgi:hypothetical protein